MKQEYIVVIKEKFHRDPSYLEFYNGKIYLQSNKELATKFTIEMAEAIKRIHDMELARFYYLDLYEIIGIEKI